MVLPFKNKRLSRTNYRRRLQLLISGKPRLVVRKTLKHTLLQLVAYDENGDKVLCSAHSKELVKRGWTASTGNIPAAYLTGLLFATRVKKAGVTQMVTDIGFHTSVYGSRIYASLKGAIDGGIALNADEKVFPSPERLRGKHIEEYATQSKQFTKSKTDISAQFEKVKAEVMKE